MKAVDEPDDSDLVSRLREGDKSAFEQIFRRYSSQLYRVVQNNIAVKEDCEEILQEIFEFLWTKRNQIMISSLKDYLFSFTRHRITDYFRKAKIRKRYEEHYRIFEIAYAMLPPTSRDSEAIRRAMEDVIAPLPKRCQMAMMLRISENLTHKEIAERMNITTKTVETYMLTAFDHIRKSSFHQSFDRYAEDQSFYSN